ncbi:hypothetical protein AA313_de0210023 [Arthrobotrys entomopaga]|nr:hypothetical protein AA313_de0210023 [Arthrobotrys entomopaga]
MTGIMNQFRSKFLQIRKHDIHYDEKQAINTKNPMSFTLYHNEKQTVQPTSPDLIEKEAMSLSTSFNLRGFDEHLPRIDTNNYHAQSDSPSPILQSPTGSVFSSDFRPLSPQQSPIAKQSLNHFGKYESALQQLKFYRTVFLVHDSVSMMRAGGISFAYDFLQKYHPHAVRYSDAKKVEIRFTSDNRKKSPLRTVYGDEFFRRIKPGECTPLVNALENILNPFEGSVKSGGRLNDKHGGLHVIIITDGVDPDRDSVAEYIVEIAGKLSAKNTARNLVGCQFVHVGNNEEGKSFCQWLDDKLPGR